jgi:hypothetical protein
MDFSSCKINPRVISDEAELQSINSWKPLGIDQNTLSKSLEDAAQEVIQAGAHDDPKIKCYSKDL